MRRRRLFDGRDGHEARDGKSELAAALGEKLIGFFRQHARLLQLAAGVDLDEELEPTALFRHLLGDGTGDLGPVDGVNGVEQRHRLARLVRLQRADQMQLEAGIERAQRRPFGLRLLEAVAAQYRMASVKHGFDLLRAESLAYRHERHRRGIAASHARGLGDLAAYAFKASSRRMDGRGQDEFPRMGSGILGAPRPPRQQAIARKTLTARAFSCPYSPREFPAHE